MDKKEFIATLVERLYQRGNETQIKESKKLNQEEQALLVVKGELTDMQVRCDLLWDAYSEGKTIEEICREIKSKLIEFEEANSNVTPVGINQWNRVKSRVRCKVYSKNRNLINAMKNGIPCFCFLDLLVTFYLQINDDNEMTMDITNEHLKEWGITKNELIAVAGENLVNSSFELVNLNERIKELMGIEKEKKNTGIVYIDPDPIYILSNESGVYGACAILNTQVMEDTYEKVGCRNFFILPSSIDELIIVPKRDYPDYDAQMLQFIVMQTNINCVDREDQLTDSVYFYEHETRLVKKLV
jgi:hypothetical protein